MLYSKKNIIWYLLLKQFAQPTIILIYPNASSLIPLIKYDPVKFLDQNSIMSGWFLQHINHCRLFNAKSCFYIYIYIHTHTHTLDIWFVNILLITFLNEQEFFFFAHS